MKVLIINGPNMNMLGRREPDIYGPATLQEINDFLKKKGNELGMETEFFQSNHEGDIIDKLHGAEGVFDYIIINPAAYTHYSVAIRDAIKAIGVPVIEVHMSNVSAREDFRSKSVTAPVCRGQITGFGANSYLLAMYAAKMDMEMRKR